MAADPTKEELKRDLRSRIKALDERIAELEDLQAEKKALKSALAALEGGSSSSAGQKNRRRKRGTQAEVARRREQITALLTESPTVSISEVADRLDIGYQTAANDVRLLKANGDLPE